MIPMEPELEGRIEQSLDSDLLLRNQRRKSLIAIIKAGGIPNGSEVYNCNYYGAGQFGAIFSFGVKEDPSRFSLYQVAKVGTYTNDPWLRTGNPKLDALNVRFNSLDDLLDVFSREAAALLAVRGNILAPEIYDFGIIESLGKKRPFIVMEEVLGRRIYDAKSPPSQEERAKIVYQYLSFLGDIHANGLVGLKDSGNKVLTELVLLNENPPRIKVLDFGNIKSQSPQYTPIADLQILREGLFNDGEREIAHTTKLGNTIVVTPEFDEGLKKMKFASAPEAMNAILNTYPQFEQELNDVNKLSKPEGLPFKPNLVKGLMERRKI